MSMRRTIWNAASLRKLKAWFSPKNNDILVIPSKFLPFGFSLNRAVFKIIFNALALALALALGLCLALRPASQDEAQRQVALGRVMAGPAPLSHHDNFTYYPGSEKPPNTVGWRFSLG